MAVSANELYPVVHDLSETEYATLSNNHRGRSAGGNHKNRPESTLAAAAQDLFTSSLWCGSNDTSNDTRQNYTSRMATTHLASHRMHEHLSAVPRSQSTSPYHPYYNHQQAPSPRSHNKQVVFAGAKSDAPSRQLEDDYVLTQQIVRCKVATLWECIQRSAGEGCGNRFCVKAIDKRRFKTKTDRDTATREISFYRWLSRKGPNTTITSIPKCYDCLEDKNHYYLVLEYEAGGNNLGMLLRDNGPLSESQMQLLAVSLLQSLLNLHDRSICHNDLHLENVLIRGIQTLDDILAMTKIETQQSVVKFCDLGRALCVTHQKIENGPSSQSTHVLSPIRHSSLYYMAPEVLGGMPPGLASDMWSVGVILFACFSGEYPFQCDPQQASVVKRAHLKRQIRQGDYAFSPPQWQQVSRSAKQFVSSLLHVDPVVRMTCREALLHPWIAHVGNVVQPTALKKSRSRRSVSSELSGKPSMPSVSELSTHTLMSDGSVSTTSSSQVTMGSGHKKSKSLVGRLWGKIKIKHRSTKSENDMSTIASSTLSSSLSQRQLFTPPVQQDVVEQQAAKAEKSL